MNISFGITSYPQLTETVKDALLNCIPEAVAVKNDTLHIADMNGSIGFKGTDVLVGGISGMEVHTDVMEPTSLTLKIEIVATVDLER